MNDLISRQAAIDMIVDNKYSLEYCKEHHIDFAIDVGLAIVKLSDMPSAQTDLITKIQNGIKATNVDDAYSCGMRNGMRWCISLIDDKEPLYEDCPSAQPEITPDGTLNVSIDADVTKVGRILLSQTGTQRGGLYYKDEQPEIIRCKDCKYCDRGIDEDGNPFLKCLGWVYGGTQEEDFCSHAERRTDDER